MVSALPIAGLLVAAVAAQTPDASLAPPTSCAPGVQIFAARGTTEAPGVGKIQTVAGNVTAAIPGSAVTAVDYPATFDDYAQSVATGSSDLGQLVKDYVKMCPDSKIALLGYSQGAQAVADLICGASSELMPVKTADLDSIYDKNSTFSPLMSEYSQNWKEPQVRTSLANRSPPLSIPFSFFVPSIFRPILTRLTQSSP